jgi:hypothetical protein
MEQHPASGKDARLAYLSSETRFHEPASAKHQWAAGRMSAIDGGMGAILLLIARKAQCPSDLPHSKIAAGLFVAQ